LHYNPSNITSQLLAMIPEHFLHFVKNLSNILAQDSEFLALAAGGSWIEGKIDEFSDIDLVIVHQSAALPVAQRKAIAESAGDLVSCFTGEHVGEPRLLICLYDNPLLHVDLKFVQLSDMTERVENPIILWERDQVLTDIIASSTAQFPHPDFQWIEDRFWVWIHYAAVKIGRGELFETLTFVSFMQQTVLGPLALISNGQLPKGVRKLEMILPNADLQAMLKTNATYDKASCLASLRSIVDYYCRLREVLMTDKVEFKVRAERQVRAYFEGIR
jgi:hypothetical protein